jgi:L-ascorbate metabolism protein UlaG (beta-lactamase superfamily)
MKIRWAGHAAFVIQAAGRTLVTDPFGEGYGYDFIPDAADIVTVSHAHQDHSGVDKVRGAPRIINATGKHTVDGIDIEGFFSYHDRTQGSERGNNIIFKIQAEGISVVHCGDIGEIVPDTTAEAIGAVDVLMVPVGDVYTINGAEAVEVMKKLRPKLVIPMHYLTPTVIIARKLATVEQFTQYFDEVVYAKQLDLTPADLQNLSGPQVCVLDYQ